MMPQTTDFFVFFASAMRRLRVERGLSQADLADIAALSVVTVNHVEGAKKSSDVMTLEKIAYAFNTSVASMVEEGRKMAARDCKYIRAIVSANIREGREMKGISQSELADLSGVSLSTIQNIESKRRSCTIDVLESVAVSLGTSAHKLLTP